MPDILRKTALALAGAAVVAMGLQGAAKADDDKVYTLRFQHSYPPSLAFYNTKQDIDVLVKGIHSVLELFG